MSWAPRQTLGELCEVIGGGTPDTKRSENYDGTIPWITVRDMNVDLIKSTERNITEVGLRASASNLIPAGNIVIATRVGLGKVCKLAVDCAINQDVKAVIPRNRKILDIDYLYWWLKSVAHHIQAEGRGATVLGVKLPFIKSLLISIPPIAEQKRIVAILDEAFEGIAKAIANAERNLANSEELFESQLQAIFNEQNGIDYALSDICSIESKLIDPKEAQFADLLHIGGGNMVTKSDSLIDLKTAKEEGLISSKFLFDAHTILYNKIRPYLMKVARPDFDGLCSADVYPLKPRKGILNRDYLFFLLLSKKFTNYAIEGSGRAGMPKVNRNHLFAYRVTLPDLDTQITSAARIDSTMNARSKLSAIYQAKLTSLQELKLALLHKAFSGQLTGKEAVVA